MILSDRDIRTLRSRARDPLIIRHVGDHSIQPCSIDMTLSNQLIKYVPHANEYLTVRSVPPVKQITFDRYKIKPGEFLLAATEQYFEIPTDHVGHVDGRSTIGRLGLIVHVTAGLIDPGFKGCITLEMYNMNGVPIELYDGMPIAQMTISRLSSPTIRSYGHPSLNSKYQNSTQITAPKPME